MTARWRATAAAVAALGTAAAAQEAPVRVRVGEHSGFSRVVIDAPRGTGAPVWGVDGAEIVVVAPGLARPLTPPAARLSRVTGFAAETVEGGQALRLRLACPCGARVQTLADGRIVIDVAQDAPRPAAPAVAAARSAPASAAPAAVLAEAPPPFEAAEPQALAATPPAPSPRPARGAEPPLAAPDPRAPAAEASAEAPARRRDAAAPQPSPAVSAAHAADAAPHADEGAPVTAQTAPAETAASPPPEPQEPPASRGAEPSAETIAAARGALLRQLTIAADEGLLQLAPQPDPPSAGTDPGHRPAPDAAAADDAALAALSGQLRARTGLDLAREGEGARRPRIEPPPAHCAAPAAFDLASWTDAAPLAEQIAGRRDRLVGEFDHPNAAAVAAYARMLVAHGFGAEARAALAAFADEARAPAMLVEISHLVEGESPGEGALKAGLGCPGPHGAFAAAAHALDGGLDAAALDVRALGEALAPLPPRARTQLVLPIASAALDAGLVGEAEALAGIAARGEPPPPDGDAMLSVLFARIDAARGEWSRAEAALAPLIPAASPAGVEAMIRLVEFRRAQGAATPPGLADDMEAVAFTVGPTAQGRRLLAAAAQARATGEGLGLALASLERLSADDAEAAAQAARDMMVDYAPTEAEGPAYAQAVLDNLHLIGDGPEADRARIATAGRLAEMGLENLAETLLAPAIARGSAPARIAAAEAAAAALEPERALAHLEGLTGDRAARARAAAHAAAGDYAAAAEAAQAGGDRALAARYGWLARNWTAAAAAGAADRRILAAWMAGAGEMPEELRTAVAADPQLAAEAETFSRAAEPDGQSLIEAAGAALEAARRRRAVLGGMLNDG